MTYGDRAREAAHLAMELASDAQRMAHTLDAVASLVRDESVSDAELRAILRRLLPE